ncbi:MAG: metallophosphoesterase [Chthoniobacteraceae bacterium]
MIRSSFQLAPGIWLDARRAIWLEAERTLAVADLHLGYAWAHRHSGQMMPLNVYDDTADRLEDLVLRYSPRELVFVGDIVHRAVPVPSVVEELGEIVERISAMATLRLIAGNHDDRLALLLKKLPAPVTLEQSWRAGPHLLVHGDDTANCIDQLEEASATGGRIIIGHEHPAYVLSDRVTTRLKCPCFLVSPQLLVLPAFSRWAAGSAYQRGKCLSHYLHACPPEQVVPIVGERLLPPLPLR